MQGSPERDDEAGVFVGTNPNPCVTCAPGVGVAKIKGGTVLVGNGVAVGSSVGGRGVAVGIAACVSATIVIAAPMAVPWTSAGDIVGVPGVPQAVRTSAAIAKIIQVYFINQFFSKFEYYFMVTLSL